jgi:hypothetical protein
MANYYYLAREGSSRGLSSTTRPNPAVGWTQTQRSILAGVDRREQRLIAEVAAGDNRCERALRCHHRMTKTLPRLMIYSAY